MIIVRFIDWLIAVCATYVGAALVLILLVFVVTLAFGTFGGLFVFERDDDDIRRPDGLRARSAPTESETGGGSDSPSPA
jgi:hypothetical protein